MVRRLRGGAEEVLTIVAPNESITILVLQLTINIFLRLLHGDVHVTIQTGQDTYGNDPQSVRKYYNA